jgi:hypothetical protein
LRLILAIQCFFAVLFGRILPAKALPPPEEPEESKQERERLSADLEQVSKRLFEVEEELEALRKARDALEEEKERAVEAAREETEQLRTRLDGLKTSQKAAEEKLRQARDDGALAALAWLQREGRLIDFLMESVDDYDDAEVGAAVRAIHKGCRKVLDEGFELVAVLEGEEESPVEVAEGFDPVAIQLTGNVTGDPPFKGTLMHHGWRTHKVSIPVPEEVDTHVLAPAEVEL